MRCLHDATRLLTTQFVTVLCSLPYKTTSVIGCSNGASVEVTVEDSSYTSAKFTSTKDAPISGYFKSWRDRKGVSRDGIPSVEQVD